MSRHNRRRTRLPRNRACKTFEVSPFSTLGGGTSTGIPRSRFPLYYGAAFPGAPSPTNIPERRRRSAAALFSYSEDLNTRHGPNRPLACQPPVFKADRGRQAYVSAKERRRLFGGEEEGEEDEGLCDKMMEFFGKLDFI